MRKAVTSDKSEPVQQDGQVEVKKRRSRRKATIKDDLSSVAVDSSVTTEGQFLAQDEGATGTLNERARLISEVEERLQAAAPARKQTEVQRQRLEEALLLAKERKRSEDAVEKLESDQGDFTVSSEDSASQVNEEEWMPSITSSETQVKSLELLADDKGIEPVSESNELAGGLRERLNSDIAEERAGGLKDLSRIAKGEAFALISKAFDDPSLDVRNAAATALYHLRADRAVAFVQALREATPQRRRNIGAAISSSGLAGDAIASLVGKSREKAQEALALLFVMARAGEVRPLMKAIEDDQRLEARLDAVNVLTLSGQTEIIPAFRRLAVRGALPPEVRSAVMEAIYQISTQRRHGVRAQEGSRNSSPQTC
ncbi:MAG TPA: hypothetical protein VLE19_11020 [Pyrinomonadaceae bacterium]|nr:hypothetical protein [Pyrinomonadaceae bacterium]